MSKLLWIALIASVSACGGPPALQNAPRPDPGVVAGLAAAAATAATLAEPDKKPEKKKKEPANRPVKNGATVPSDVFDRLDAVEEAPAESEPTPDDEAVLAIPSDGKAPVLPPPIVREP